ncbi:MAG: esterase/lipase family protein [Steroidobacteraceae bacterium]
MMAREAVVYVHGLWSSRADSFLLRRRLASALGCQVWVFTYSSISSSMGEVIEQLHRFIGERCGRGPLDALHWVGHSLGGLVIYRFLERHTDHLPGRVVFIGTPAVACCAAVGLARLRFLAPFIGQCVREELLIERERRWSNPRELGIIAGTRPLGFGRVVARLEGENDGTVAVSETRLPGASDFITLPATHMGLLVSTRAARETAVFLRAAHFSLSPRVPFPPVSSTRSS